MAEKTRQDALGVSFSRGEVVSGGREDDVALYPCGEASAEIAVEESRGCALAAGVFAGQNKAAERVKGFVLRSRPEGVETRGRNAPRGAGGS